MIVEDWVAHLLGIVPRTPVLTETLPSCVTWMRASRRVTTTLSAPWGDRRPPLVTFNDSFQFSVPADGSPAAQTQVVLIRDHGWVPLVKASPRYVTEGVARREQIAGEVIQGDLVIDFRPAPDLPGLESDLKQAEAELRGPERELFDQRVQLGVVQRALHSLRGRKELAEGALAEEKEELDGAQVAARAAQEALDACEEALREAEAGLTTAVYDVVEASAKVEVCQRARDAAVWAHERAQGECTQIVAAIAEALDEIAGLSGQIEHKVGAQASLMSSCEALDAAVVKLRRTRDAKKDAADAEALRSKTQPERQESIDEIALVIRRFKRLHHIGMFLGQATFWKCWVKICIHAGTRVQIKRKLAPYLNRPLWYGFDGLKWNADVQVRETAIPERAVLSLVL